MGFAESRLKIAKIHWANQGNGFYEKGSKSGWFSDDEGSGT
jgi:hypothetical protein